MATNGDSDIKDNENGNKDISNNQPINPLVQIAEALNFINQRMNKMQLSIDSANVNIQLLGKQLDINEKKTDLAFKEIESLEKKL